jgi:hypothetical protein
MSKPLLLVVLALVIPVFGCSSDSTPQPVLSPLLSPPPPPPPPPPAPGPVAAADVGGTWFTRIANNAVNCGLGEFVDAQALVITQDVNDITLLTSSGNTFAGTVNGDIVEWMGDVDERGGTTTFTSLSIIVSGSDAAGNAAWTWTDGTDSCNGTMAITASQDWGVPDGVRNSGPHIADPIVLTDGVAFIAGTLTKVTDRDFFSLVPTVDVTVQAELSHFDPQTNDLLLELLDEDENQIVLSDSADGFEKVEAQLLAGKTYYIVMRPNLVPGFASYNLSIDVN